MPAPKHILIAEDEPHTRIPLVLVLRRSGFRVTAVSDGRQVLDVARQAAAARDPVDLLILDVQMPEMTGIDVLDHLRKQDLALPVLIISGYHDSDMVLEASRRGCIDYLEKPFTPEDLVKRVSAVLARSGTTQAQGA